MIYRSIEHWEDIQKNQQENEIIKAQEEAVLSIKADPENINEQRMMMLANAKRDWADLTDFEVTKKTINVVEENELTDKKITITVSK